MPHVKDKSNYAECARLLRGPVSLERAARVNGRRIIDTSDRGQQEFQALLLWALLSPNRSIRWDSRIGRSFREIFLYFSWASPQPGHMATGWTVAARIAAYLLPEVERDHKGTLRFCGIPGLRFTETTARSIRLTHIPTGGIIDLAEQNRQTARFMEEHLLSEVSCAHSPASDDVTWTASRLTEVEETALFDWPLPQHAPLLSAIMARISLLWRYWDNGSELDVNPISLRPRLSWWAGPSSATFVDLLSNSPISVAGLHASRIDTNTRIIWLGDSALELRGPSRDSKDPYED